MKRVLSLSTVIMAIIALTVLLAVGWVNREFRWELGARAALAVYPLKISGTVTDAQSGEPVSGFTLTPGAPFGDRFSWGTAVNYPASANRYQEIFRSPPTSVSRSSGGLVEVVLQFKAPGYRPFVSRAFRPHSGSWDYDVRLQRAVTTRGIVVGVDRLPAKRVEVLVLSKLTASWLTLENGRVRGWSGDRVVTDENGRFELECPEGDFHLLVVDPAGFAVLPGNSREAELQLVVQPWARLDGRWLEKGRPTGVTSVQFHAGSQWNLSISLSPTYSPGDGTFGAAKIPPGPFAVQWQPPRARGEPFTSIELAQGDARPGETSFVECSTEFRSVAGQVVREGSVDQLRFDQCFVSLNPVQEAPPRPPPELATPADEERWWAAWRATEEGRTFATMSNRRRQMTVQSDGSFSSPWIVPGSYWLSGDWRDGRQKFGRIETRRVEIGAGPGMLDLGKFTVAPNERTYLAKGERAPSFSVPGLTGGSVSLAARPGKFVLLDFWATGCGPCLAEIPRLRAVFDHYRSDPRVQIISLDLDSSQQHAAKYAAASRMDWPQGYLAGGWKDPVAQSYGVDAIPALFLIGPDGKILARDLRGANIEAEVADALRE